MPANAISSTPLVPLVHATRVVGLLAAGLLAGAVAVIWPELYRYGVIMVLPGC
jgi:hypothetical protein